MVIQRGEIWWAFFSRGLLTEHIGALPVKLLKQVEEELRLVLALQEITLEVLSR